MKDEGVVDVENGLSPVDRTDSLDRIEYLESALDARDELNDPGCLGLYSSNPWFPASARCTSVECR